MLLGIFFELDWSLFILVIMVVSEDFLLLLKLVIMRCCFLVICSDGMEKENEGVSFIW